MAPEKAYIPTHLRELVAVDRAADELRRALPAVVYEGGEAAIVFPAELAAPDTRAKLCRLGEPRLLLTQERAAMLKIRHKGKAAVRVLCEEHFTHRDIRAAADPARDLERPLKGPFQPEDRPERELERAALTLLKRARLLPAALLVDASEPPEALAQRHGLIAVAAGAIEGYAETAAANLQIVARARLPLANAPDTQVVAFRPESGGSEHFALLIGDPAPHEPVLLRIHSECFTGDALGSLKCDCGSQLAGAVDTIAEAGGGVLLYLAQEGRGIGLVAKLKAYALQDQGFDTVDANLRLGFAADERVYAPARAMLEALGFSRVRLLTNNPEKQRALEAEGVAVTERVPHAFPANAHNAHYLATKRDKTGHVL